MTTAVSLAVLGPYGALEHRFQIECDRPEIARWLTDVLVPLRSDEPALATYRLVGAEPTRLLFDGEPVAEGRPSHVLGMLLWHVNREAVARSPNLVRVHAAAAARGDDAVLLPAEMEAGKTTLVAGLVQRGLSYLSDEVAAIEPVSLRLRAYPKPLSIDPGSWEVLAGLRPRAAPEHDGLLPQQWIVPAGDIRPGAERASAQPRLLVAPRYEAGAVTSIAPLGRADAFLHVAASTFELRATAERDLRVLEQVVRRCSCYRLVVGDLDAACAAVFELLDRLDGGAA